MSKTDYLQLIPILTLTAYFFYVTYYYVIPMFRLKVLLFYAHIKYRGADIRFSDWKITMVYTKGGEEQQTLGEEQATSRGGRTTRTTQQPGEAQQSSQTKTGKGTRGRSR